MNNVHWTRGLAVAGALLIGSVSHSAMAATYFNVDLMELNNSGVTGTGLLTLNDDMSELQVQIFAQGLEVGMPHVGHIHGLFDDGGTPANSMVPTMAADTDNDGFIELGEGVPLYGPIIVPLTNLTVGPTGMLFYDQTFDLSDNSIFANGFTKDALFPLSFREIVLHGLTVPAGIGAGTMGEVDGTNGYLAVLPVAAGVISPIPEPATWAMMIFGFGAIGAVLRRRNHARPQVTYS